MMVMLSISFRYIDYLDSRKGIDLDSTRCPLCDDALETESHLFVECCIARDAWSKVLGCLNIRNSNISTLPQALSHVDHSNLPASL